MIQNRDGLAPELLEEKRFFERYGESKTATPTGWNDPHNWKYIDDIPAGRPFGFNIKGSSYALIDFDHVINDAGQLYTGAVDVIHRLDAIAPTYRERSVSGHGVHLIIDLQDYADCFPAISNKDSEVVLWMSPQEYSKLEKEARDKVPKIEIFYKTGGRYIYLTGQHGRGQAVQRVVTGEAAANILHELLTIREELHARYGYSTQISAAPESAAKYQIDEISTEAVIGALAYVPSTSYETWIRCGMALCNVGIDFSVWDEWSKYSRQIDGTPYTAYDHDLNVKKWESFAISKSRWNEGTIFRLANENGWKRDVVTVEASAAPGLPGLKRAGNGRAKKCFENYVAILREDPFFKGKIHMNGLSGRIEVGGFPWELDKHTIRDSDLSNIKYKLSDKYDLSNKDNIRDAISMVAQENMYHPICDILDSLKWDGVPRIGELLPRYLGAERSAYTETVTLIMLHGAIQRVKNPGVKFDLCVILADKEQGGGKSSMCEMLALDGEYYTDQLKDFDNLKTAFEVVSGKWIVELSELLAVRRTEDVEAIKSYISRRIDSYRVPYGTYSQDFPRQAIFIGTTNRAEFLPRDISGNRRFLPVLCNRHKADVHPLHDPDETRAFIAQCYAEAIVRGERDGWMLTLPYELEKTLEDIQAQAVPEETEEGMVEVALDRIMRHMLETRYTCSRMIYDWIYNREENGVEKNLPRVPTKRDLATISDIMNYKVRGWHRYGRYRFAAYGQQRAWERDDVTGCDKGVTGCDKATGAVTDSDGFRDFPAGEELPFPVTGA